MSALYYVTPTDYGLSLIAQAHNSGNIKLVNLVLGDANGIPYNPISQKSRTSLINQRASVPISAIHVSDGSVQVTALIGNTIGGFNIHEIGLTDHTGKLVYIGNYHGAYKPELQEGAGGELYLFIEIKLEQGANVIIQASEGNIFLKFLIDTLYHVGSCHGTYSMDYDPSIELEKFFGYKTVWRLSPDIPQGVSNLNATLNTVNFLASEGNKKTRTLRIWRRMPDDYVDPVFKFERISPGIIEGNLGIYDVYAQFKLTTTGVAPGTQFAWEVINDPNGYIYLSTTRQGTQVPKNGVLTIGQNGTATLTVVPHYSTEGFNTVKAGELHNLDIQLETGDIASQGIFLPQGVASASMSKLNNQEFSLSITRSAGRSVAYKIVFLSGTQYIVLPGNDIVYLNGSVTVSLAPEFIIHPENIPENAMISGKFVAQEPRWDGTYEERSFSCYVK